MSQYPAYPPPAFVPPAAFVQDRPGIVTAIAVIGIIVASLSMVAGLISGGMISLRYSIGTAAANSAGSRNINGSAIGGATTQPASAMGLPTPTELAQQEKAERTALEFRRDTLASLFNDVQPMTPQQQSHLAAMLGQYGDRLLPQSVLQAEALSPADLRENITRSGTSIPAHPGDPDPVYFDLKSGRLDVFVDGAVFRPADSSTRLRAAAGKSEALSGLRPTSRPATPSSTSATLPGKIYHSGLTEREVASAMQTIQTVATQSGATLTPAQAQTPRTELQETLPPLISRQTLYAPVSQIIPQPDGSVVIRLTTAYLVIDSAGNVSHRFSTLIHQAVLDPVVGVLTMGEFIASEVLAIFLLVVSIAALRQYRRSAGLFWIYALLKIPVAVIGGVALVWGTTQLGNDMARLQYQPLSGASDGVVTFSVILTIVSCLFPVGLMIVLSTRSVREFYASLRSRST